MSKKQALQFTARVESEQGKREMDIYNTRDETLITSIKNYGNKGKEY